MTDRPKPPAPPAPSTPPTTVITPVPEGGTPAPVPNPPVPAAPELPQYPADVTGLIEKVRTEEKKKLYGELEKLKLETQQKDLRIKELELAVKEIQAKLPPPEDEEAKKKKRGELETQIASLEKSVAENMDRMSKDSDAQIALLKDEIRKRDLAIYRERQIGAVVSKGEGLIPELVNGDTESKIDESIILSKQRYAEILAKAKSNGSQSGTPSPAPAPTAPVPPVPAGGGGALIGERAGNLSAEQIRTMSMEDYAKRRMELRKDLDSQFKRAHASATGG